MKPAFDESIAPPGYAKSALEYLHSKGVSRANPLEREVARRFRGIGPKTLRYLEAGGLVVSGKPQVAGFQVAAANGK